MDIKAAKKIFQERKARGGRRTGQKRMAPAWPPPRYDKDFEEIGRILEEREGLPPGMAGTVVEILDPDNERPC